MSHADIVALHVEFTVLPGNESEARPLFMELVSNSKKDAGCLQYDLFVSPDDEHTLMLFERWASQDDLDAHGKQDWFSSLFERLGKTLAKQPVITRLAPYQP